MLGSWASMRRLLAVVLMVALASLPPAPVGAGSEPPLSIKASVVASRMKCTGNLAATNHKPVLLIHGTTSNSKSNWSWTWDRALDARHWAHCDLDLPANGNNDIQVSAEYVVWALRLMRQQASRRISIVGHSQGGMIARWSLKYWPSTRQLVDDYVALAPSNHGSRAASFQCTTLASCTAANWQQQAGSHFLSALNKGPEAWPSISYTAIITTYDEVVPPAEGGYLEPGANVTNVAVQDLCPTETVDHFGMAYDNAAWLIGLDALTHAGPARLSRVSRATCGRPFMPSVDPATFAVNAAMALSVTARSSASATQLAAEPKLKCYATTAC